MVVLRIILVILATISSGFLCWYIVKVIGLWLRKRKLSTFNIDKQSLFAWFMRNGIGVFKKPCNFVIKKISFLDNFFENIVLLLKERNLVANKQSVSSTLLGLLIVVALLFSLVFGSPIAGLTVVLLLIVCLFTTITALMNKRSEELRNSVPDALRSMGTCFGAGYTLLQTFEQVANESNGRIKSLFNKSTHVLQIGGSINESLECLKKAAEAPELAFVAVALDVQHQTGGSMKPVIDSAKDMVESKLELLRLLNVQTSQAKLSARIVTILPFALIAIFSIISPNFLTPFFSSFVGICVFALASVMQIAGVILVRKMLKVEL
ncbi:MAG: type II secretion system F family protein [Coriobacteriia bacterium]|nr:type II secretion system F family protein [Coriobacteriia bacterium]